MICNLSSLYSYQFVNGPFGACNCSGIQTRLVICISRSGNDLVRVADQVCLDNGVELPALTMKCPVPSNCLNPVWQTTDYNGVRILGDVFRSMLEFVKDFFYKVSSYYRRSTVTHVGHEECAICHNPSSL